MNNYDESRPEQFPRPEPHLPLRRASSQRLHSYNGLRPFFSAQQHSLRGFNPSPVQPSPQVVNITASSEHAFAARDDRTRVPYKPPLGVQVMQRSPQKSRQLRATTQWPRERTQPYSPYMSQESTSRLRGYRSVGADLRGMSVPAQASTPSPRVTEFPSSDSIPTMGMTEEEIRSSMRSALTGNSSRINSSGVNTGHSSFVTVNSHMSDQMDTTLADDDSRDSFDVDDAIGLYEDGFESDKNSFNDEHRRKSSTNPRPITADQYHQQRPSFKHHRRSQSASILDKVSSPPKSRVSMIVSANDAQRWTPRDEPKTAIPRDRYGFKKASHYVTVEQYDEWDRKYQIHLERRRKKWLALLKSYGLSTDNPIRFPPKSDKIKRYIRKGIPPEWRGAAWFWYAGGPGLLKRDPGLYQRLLKLVREGQLSENDREHIERDLNRTFPDNLRFKPDPSSTLDAQGGAGGGVGVGQRDSKQEVPIVAALRRVLQAFAVHNPSIGYCQSLNFIAGLLLLFLNEDEEKSFILLTQITSVHLPGTHGVTLEGANIDIAVLMSCIKDSLPAVWAKLDDKADTSALPPVAQALRLPTVSLATTAWFMSLFVGTLPIEGVLRTWDCLFFEGSKTLFRIALAIFKAGEKQILTVNDPMEIFQLVQTIPRSMLDVNALLDVCFKRRGGFGYLSQDVIERRREERRKQVKAGLAGSASNGWRSRWRSKTTKV